MALKVGELFAELDLNDKLDAKMKKAETNFKSSAKRMDHKGNVDIDDSKARAAMGRLGTAADSVKTKFLAVGAAGLAMGAGAVALGKSFFDAAGDLAESSSKVKVVFGETADEIFAFADNSAKSMGISKQATLEAAGTFGNLFRAMQINTDKSAEMSTAVIALGSDLASFNNARPEDVLIALKAGLVGETEPLRQFGVNLNEARIQAEAQRLGLAKSNVSMSVVESKTIALTKAQVKAADVLKTEGANSLAYADAKNDIALAEEAITKAMEGSNIALTAGEKAQAAYSLIMADTALAQGDFERTAEGSANKSRILAAEWENAKAKFGEKISPIGMAALGAMSTGLDKITTWFDENADDMERGLGKVSDAFHAIFGEDPGANFAAGLDTISTKLDEVFGEDKTANFQAGADIVRTKWDELSGDFERGAGIVSEKVQPVWDAIGNSLIWIKDSVLDPLLGTAQTVLPLLGELFGLCVEVIEVSVSWLVDEVLDPLFGTIQGIPDFFTGLPDRIREKVSGMWDGLTQSFRDALNWIIDKWNAFSITTPNIPGTDIGGMTIDFPDIPRLHGGGEFRAPNGRSEGLALLSDRERVLTPAQSASGAGGFNVGGMVINNVREKETPFEITRRLRQASYFAGGR